jgi:hypothetical protein
MPSFKTIYRWFYDGKVTKGNRSVLHKKEEAAAKVKSAWQLSPNKTRSKVLHSNLKTRMKK